MPRISPVIERLRDTCIEAIDTMIVKGKATSVKDAAELIYSKARQRHRPTGFPMATFKRFYWSVIKWLGKRREGPGHLPLSSPAPSR